MKSCKKKEVGYIDSLQSKIISFEQTLKTDKELLEQLKALAVATDDQLQAIKSLQEAIKTNNKTLLGLSNTLFLANKVLDKNEVYNPHFMFTKEALSFVNCQGRKVTLSTFQNLAQYQILESQEQIKVQDTLKSIKEVSASLMATKIIKKQEVSLARIINSICQDAVGKAEESIRTSFANSHIKAIVKDVQVHHSIPIKWNETMTNMLVMECTKGLAYNAKSEKGTYKSHKADVILDTIQKYIIFNIFGIIINTKK